MRTYQNYCIPFILVGFIACAGLLECPALASGELSEQVPVRLPSKVLLQGHNGRHSFIIHLEKRAFRRKNHRITKRSDGYRVDGKFATGAAVDIPVDRLPKEEFNRFDVSVDGKRWIVPARLWQDCYQPNFVTNTRGRTIWAWVSKDGKRLTMKMLGSDGAAAYMVIWHLRRNGHHSRKIENRA